MSPRWIRSSSKALAAFLAAALWLPAPVHAGKAPKAARAMDAQVRKLYAAAQKAYDLGRFEEALKGFSDAYALKDLPGFLFNIAQCHRNLGNHERAKFFYLRYLDLSPTRPKNAAQVEKLLAKVEEKLAEEEAARLRREEEERAAAAQRQKERELEEKRAAEREAAAKLAAAAALPAARALPPPAVPGPATAQLPPAPAAAPAQPGPVFTQWWFWTGVGVVAAGAGAATYVLTAPAPRPTTLGDLGSP